MRLENNIVQSMIDDEGFAKMVIASDIAKLSEKIEDILFPPNHNHNILPEEVMILGIVQDNTDCDAIAISICENATEWFDNRLFGSCNSTYKITDSEYKLICEYTMVVFDIKSIIHEDDEIIIIYDYNIDHCFRIPISNDRFRSDIESILGSNIKEKIIHTLNKCDDIDKLNNINIMLNE